MDLDKGGNAADWFLMAAIDHHLGNDSDARRWYERAISWLKQHNLSESTGDLELRRSREEAIRALGLAVSDSDDGTTGFVIEAMNEAGQHVEPRGDFCSFRPEIWAGHEGTEAAAGSCSRNPTQRSSPNVKLLCTRGYYRCSQSKERSRTLPATSMSRSPSLNQRVHPRGRRVSAA